MEPGGAFLWKGEIMRSVPFTVTHETWEEAVERCQLCGGNAGRLIDGAHALCAAKAARGLPTPSLGDACVACNGVGRVPRTPAGPVVFCAAGPAAFTRAFDAWAPRCEACGGTGVVESRN